MTAEIFDRQGLCIVSAARPSGPVLSLCIDGQPATLSTEDAIELRDAIDRWLGDHFAAGPTAVERWNFTHDAEGNRILLVDGVRVPLIDKEGGK